MKASVVICGTTFSLVTQQVYRQIHTLLLVFIPLSLIYSGPTISTLVQENAGASLTQKSGNGGADGAAYGLHSALRQIMQSCNIFQAN